MAEHFKSYTSSYNFSQRGGLRLPVGKSVVVSLPLRYRNCILRNLMLSHRKDKSNRGDMAKVGQTLDRAPAYTRIEARISGTNKWHAYIDDFGNGGAGSKQRQPGKFAEPRGQNNPEVEGLHDWQLQKVGPQCYDAIRITSAGKKPSHIHGFRAYFYPKGSVVGKPTQKVYTPGTSFGGYPPATSGRVKGPVYGGGEDWVNDIKEKKGKKAANGAVKANGLYPNALVLRKSHSPSSNNFLRIPVPAGAKCVYLEVSCGDTTVNRRKSLEGQKDEHGFIGTRHDARLHVMTKVGRLHALKGEAVPPSGVIGCYIPMVKGSADELIVWSQRASTYVMGYRAIGLTRPSSARFVTPPAPPPPQEITTNPLSKIQQMPIINKIFGRSSSMEDVQAL